jgi:hypothetical protein
MKKFAFIDNDDKRFYNVEFSNYIVDAKIRTDTKIVEVTYEDIVKYDLINKPTVSYFFPDFIEL